MELHISLFFFFKVLRLLQVSLSEHSAISFVEPHYASYTKYYLEEHFMYIAYTICYHEIQRILCRVYICIISKQYPLADQWRYPDRFDNHLLTIYRAFLYQLVTNELSHSYHLDDFNFRVIRNIFSSFTSFFDDIHDSKQNSPRWDAAFGGIICLHYVP